MKYAIKSKGSTLELKLNLLLDYKMVFNEEPPDNRLSLITNLCKKHILYELVGLNYILKPHDTIVVDYSFATQIRFLKQFAKTETDYKLYSQAADKFTKSETDFPLFFTRASCLFAVEEILSSSEMNEIEGFTMDDPKTWEAILKYLLSVNYQITQIKKEESPSFESLNSKLIPLNELGIETDFIFTAYRGFCLMNYFSEHEVLGAEIEKYFALQYGIAPLHFLFHVMASFMANKNPNPEHNFHYRISDVDKEIFDRVSVRKQYAETFRLLNIKKNPFIKTGENTYILTDSVFWIEKLYSQLLNDFWFDHVKAIQENGEPKFTFSFYRSVFGMFFEDYIYKVILRSFENYKYSVLRMFNELKVTVRKKTSTFLISDYLMRTCSRYRRSTPTKVPFSTTATQLL